MLFLAASLAALATWRFKLPSVFDTYAHPRAHFSCGSYNVRMIANAPYQQLSIRGITIEGWSRAGIQSYWQIPEWSVGFDIGVCPWQFRDTDTWLISHTHLDHMAALPVLLARRNMMRLAPPKIVVPEAAFDDVMALLRCWEKLDRGIQHCDLVGAAPGDIIPLGNRLSALVFATKHTIPSQGYLIREQRQKLKPEYADLAPDQIRERKRASVAMTEAVEFPLLAYTGDTSVEGLDDNPFLYRVPILLTEMSFVEESSSRDRVRAFGHMHLQDILERAAKFENEKLIVSHLTTRTSEAEVRRILDAELPANLRSILHLWI